MDPEHYIESIPSRYTLADMIFPDERLEFPTSGINDFHTSRRIIRMTAEVRQKYKNKKLQIIPVIPYADATPAKNDDFHSPRGVGY
jgi:hypothetical protein